MSDGPNIQNDPILKTYPPSHLNLWEIYFTLIQSTLSAHVCENDSREIFFIVGREAKKSYLKYLFAVLKICYTFAGKQFYNHAQDLSSRQTKTRADKTLADKARDKPKLPH